MELDIVTIDFETYFNSKDKYSLKNMSIVEYIHDPRFYVQGLGWKVGNYPAYWISGNKIKAFFNQVKWRNVSAVIAHNIKFDGAILAWKYGIKPKQWIDTKALVKAMLGNTIPTASLKHSAEALGLPAKGELNTDGKRELTEEEEKELAVYCIRDTDIAHSIYQKFKDTFPKGQWDIMDWTVRTFLEPKLSIDGAKCKEIYEASVAHKKELVENIGIAASVFRSNQQFAELLVVWGFKVPMKNNKKGKLIPALAAKDEAFIKMLASDNNTLRALCEVRRALKQTLEETRAKKMYEISKISKYCFDVIFSGAQTTHRFSGGNGCAGNPQNFGKTSKLREAICV